MKFSVPVLVFLLTCSISCQQASSPADETPVSKNKTVEPIVKDGPTPTSVRINTDTVKKQVSTAEWTPKISRPEAIGLWMVPKEKSLLEKDGIGMIPWQSIFNYDGRYVTVQIMFVVNGTPIYPPKWPSKDGFYKLKTQWHGDSLFYHSPFKKTEFLALYSDSVFLRKDVYEKISNTWQYERITEKEVPEYLKPVLKKRKVFDYSKVK